MRVMNRGAFLPSNTVNFDENKINQSVDFVKLAYNAYSGGEKAKKYAQLSAEMEKAGYTISTFAGDTGHNPLTDYFVQNSRLGVIAKSNDEVVVAFRGTKDKADILSDLYVWNPNLKKDRFLEQEKGGVHVGFNKTFESYREFVKEQVLDSVKGGVKNVMITGHSMGGAQANLMALYLAQTIQQMGYRDVSIKLVTYNAPRVGSENFANKLNEALGEENISRFTKGRREIVSSVIFGSFGFKHAGTNVVVPSESTIKIKDHKNSNFAGGAAGQSLVEHNEDPKKAKGFRYMLKEAASNLSEGVKSVGTSIKNGISSFGSRLKGWFS